MTATQLEKTIIRKNVGRYPLLCGLKARIGITSNIKMNQVKYNFGKVRFFI